LLAIAGSRPGIGAATTGKVRVRNGGLRLIGLVLALLLAPAAIVGAAAADPTDVVVRTGEHADRSRIVFDWTIAVSASVEDGQTGQLIVAFDRPASFDLTKASLKHLTRIAAIEPVDGRAAVRITLRGQHGYKLADVDGKVVLDILDDTATTEAPVKSAPQGQSAVSTKTATVSPPVDAAAVSRPSGATAEGVSRPIAASSATVAPAGRLDTGPSFLALRQPVRAPVVVPPPPPDEPVPDPLFDPQAWRGDGGFAEARAALPKLVGTDPRDSGAVLKLAQFYFAWRHADEALSALDTLERVDPKRAARIDVLALADAARIMARRRPMTAGVFERPNLRDRPEVQLWRGAAAAMAGQFDKALPAFQAGKPALTRYTPDFQAFFSLLAMRASLDQKAIDAAQSYQAVAEAAQPRDEEGAMLEALTGVLLAAQGHADDARWQLRKVIYSPALRAQILARLALIRLDRDAGKLTDDDAIGALEQIYYAWEGDSLQLDAIDQLVPLLIAGKQYDKAFEVIAVAQKEFPNEARTAALGERARGLYRSLMTDDGPTAPDALATVALFDAHRDLLPGGAEGIAIQRRLAKRLAQLDLVAPAARILQDTLKSAPADQQAEIAMDTADLLMDAGDADGALKTLDASKSDAVSAALADRRAQLEAQALADSGQDIAALAALGTAAGAGDDRTRADVYWRNGEWELAAKDYLAAVHLGDADAPVTGADADHDAHLILRATAALLLAGKRADVAALHDKYGPALAKSTVAAVFDKLTKADAGVEVLAQPDVSAEIVKLD